MREAENARSAVLEISAQAGVRADNQRIPANRCHAACRGVTPMQM
jgi:hypothetical protein